MGLSQIVSRRNERSVMKRNSETQFKTSGVVFSLPPLIFAAYNIHAYIDLGTGSLIIQVLIASFIGGLFLLKGFWAKVKAFFKDLFSKARRGDG